MIAWPLTLFDYVVLTIMVSSVIISVVRGFVNEILSLCAWFAAFVVATRWGADLAGLLPDAIDNRQARLIAGFGLLFVGTLIVGGLVTMAIEKMIKATRLTLADRGLGGVFGLARGALIVLTLVILCGLTALPQQAFWRDALLAPVAESGVRTIKPMLPPQWAQFVHY